MITIRRGIRQEFWSIRRTSKVWTTSAAFAVLLLVFASHAEGKDVVISPDSDIGSIAKSLEPGDSVILRNGSWTNVELKFERLTGTGETPIYIRPETNGGVVFAGKSQLRLSGDYVIVSGFVFRDVFGVSDVVQLRSHSERQAHNCRITDCVFEQTANSESGTESRWLSVYGTNNRVDHCFFAGKSSPGTTLVVWVSDQPGGHRIDHNHFGPRPKLGRNGGETIRIGTSEVSELACKTIVEENYFHRCDGEAEIISNKSCDNVYRHNLFDECSGALTLRHGHRCTVVGNVFLGRKSPGTGGVRIIGRDHVVSNNYFEGLRGDAERAAISLMNGVPNGALNSYAPVVGAVVANNTIVDCKVTLELGLGASRIQSASPVNCKLTHNLVQPEKWQVFRVHSMPVGTEWSSNFLQPSKEDPDMPFDFERRLLGLERADDVLLRPQSLDAIRTGTNSPIKIDIDGYPRTDRTLAGCDDPETRRRPFPSRGSTGPTWRAAAN